MAVFSKKTVLLFFFAIIIIAAIFRYPLTSHERDQTDSYFIHNLSRSIQDDGYAIWVVNPLSYLGYYPLSYPSGYPFLVSEVSILTGVTIEAAILLSSVMLGALLAISVFCLSREFITREDLVLVSVLLCSLGPRMLDSTQWSATARGPASILMTLTIFAALRAAYCNDRRLYILAVVFAFTCVSIHHIAVLLILFGVAFLFSAAITREFSTSIRSGTRRLSYGYAIGFALVLVFVGALEYSIGTIQSAFATSGAFDIEPRVLSALLNMMISFSNQIGPVFPVAMIGFALSLRLFVSNQRRLFLLLLFVSFIPVVDRSIYISQILLPFAAIAATVFFAGLFRDRRRAVKWAKTALVVVLISSTVYPAYAIQRWNELQDVGGNTVVVSDQLFNDAIYVKRLETGLLATANVDDYSVQIAAVSGTGFLHSGIYLLLNENINKSRLAENVKFSEAIFPVNLYLWLEFYGDPEVDGIVMRLFLFGVPFLHDPYLVSQKAVDFFSSHPCILVAVDSDWENEFVTRYASLPSKLQKELLNSSYEMKTDEGVMKCDLDSYMIYHSDKTMLYMVCLPLESP